MPAAEVARAVSRELVLAPALRPFLAGVTAYDERGQLPGVHRGLPGPHLTLVLTFDDPLVLLAHPDPAQPPGSYGALLGGLHVRPALIASPGHQAGVQLSLTPLGARALLGLPAAALASRDVPLTDVLGSTGAELLDRLRAAPDARAQVAALERVLLRTARHGAALAPEVAEAWRLLVGGAGRHRVDEVARAVGWSPRHLRDRFRDETGLTPKQVARVARFDRARRLLVDPGTPSSGDGVDLAALAAGCGYADQAHLTREWRALSGLPPRAWAAAERRSVQDTAAPAAAPSGA